MSSIQRRIKAGRQADYIARTSDYTYLVEKRLWQLTQLQRAEAVMDETIRIHRTSNGPLNITVCISKAYFSFCEY